MTTTAILHVAVPTPLRRLFDYLPPADTNPGTIHPGCRVEVTFGRRQVIGIVVTIDEHSDFELTRLKPAIRLLDDEPLWSETDFALLQWAASYYHHPLGDVLQTALPVMLRQARPAHCSGFRRWTLTPTGQNSDPNDFKRAPKQAAVLARIAATPDGIEEERLAEIGGSWRDALKRLQEKGLIAVTESSAPPAPELENDVAPPLNPAQQEAVTQIAGNLQRFHAHLLEGVTGSGKTEVYLAAMETVLAAGKQVMVLVPEIGLTPQLLQRFSQRLAVPTVMMHSALADGERLCAWLAARSGDARLIIGTRSAILAPFADLGLIVIDEEHDASYKQQDGFRYSARDVAVVRAQRLGIPLLLGSATPSLESLHNARSGRYQHLRLPERAGEAIHPSIRILDVSHRPHHDGLAEPLLAAMGRHLQAGNQVLVFLNRRGYAPTMLCQECGWVGECQRCDAHMVVHVQDRRLRCHHCGADKPLPKQCPGCGSPDLRPLGHGTERLEAALAERFPDVRALRIDRESTRRKGSMDAMLEQVHSGEAQLLIGTQMLAKGHHFPNVTLVAVVNADQGLFSADFRAPERLAQLIIQVAGRAGRAERPGEVIIQTQFPDHPLFSYLVNHDYAGFADSALQERQSAQFPPFAHLALLRAEAVNRDMPRAFLSKAVELAQPDADGVMLLGPIPAPMEKRGGRSRAQLLLQAESRQTLHRLLGRLLPQLETCAEGRKVRWSLDVDPQELF